MFLLLQLMTSLIDLREKKRQQTKTKVKEHGLVLRLGKKEHQNQEMKEKLFNHNSRSPCPLNPFFKGQPHSIPEPFPSSIYSLLLPHYNALTTYMKQQTKLNP